MTNASVELVGVVGPVEREALTEEMTATLTTADGHAAQDAVLRLAGLSATNMLVVAFRHPDERVQLAAIRALGQLGTRAAIWPLLDELAHVSACSGRDSAGSYVAKKRKQRVLIDGIRKICGSCPQAKPRTVAVLVDVLEANLNETPGTIAAMNSESRATRREALTALWELTDQNVSAVNADDLPAVRAAIESIRRAAMFKQ